jgi:hypothetical protein
MKDPGFIQTVEEYFAKAVVPGWVVERPGRESLILKRVWFFDGEVSGYCVTGKKVR